jgi:hypothetical protein
MTRPGQAPGPFETEQQARQLPAVRAVYDAFDRDPGVGKMAGPNQRMLLDALAAAGVYLGAFDHRIVEWLAGWEPQTVAMVCGWVQRAGQAAARAGQLPARMREGPPGAAAARPLDRATTTHADPPPAQEAKS